jgi:L-lactate dehydrogenase complex protein LldG
MSEARTAILERIRSALGTPPEQPQDGRATIDRTYRQESQLTRDERVEVFASRIVHYDGSVRRCRASELPDTIAQTLAARDKTRIYVPSDIDRSWLPNGIDFAADEHPSTSELDRSEGVITGCTVAIALTGTIVLTHGKGEGRRALTLVPDYHLSIVFADQIVETVPEGIRRVAAQSPSLITTISGPSATADIEMTRIKGVHGPRVLDVIIVAS